jgi:hypothetical protein
MILFFYSCSSYEYVGFESKENNYEDFKNGETLRTKKICKPMRHHVRRTECEND